MSKERSGTKSDQATKAKEQKREVKYILSRLKDAKKHIKQGHPFNASNILLDVVKRLTTPVT